MTDPREQKNEAREADNSLREAQNDLRDAEGDVRDAGYELAVLERARQMREADLVDFIRETVVRLEVLADRLEAVGGQKERPEPEGAA